MRCPDTDLGFAEHPVHGADAQLRLLRSVVALLRGPRRRAIDVGAHIGTWSIPLAERFEYVDAFEPLTRNFECLEKNTWALTNIARHPVAVGSVHGRCRITNFGENSGCGFVTKGGDFLMMTLDAFDWTDVDFIKLDIEGYEGHALAGARRLLDRCKPAVFFEDNGIGPTYHGETWIDPKAILSDSGYRRQARIQKNELWCFG